MRIFRVKPSMLIKRLRQVCQHIVSARKQTSAWLGWTDAGPTCGPPAFGGAGRSYRSCAWSISSVPAKSRASIRSITSSGRPRSLGTASDAVLLPFDQLLQVTDIPSMPAICQIAGVEMSDEFLRRAPPPTPSGVTISLDEN